MNGEYLSLITAQKLSNIDRAVRYIKNYIKVEPDNSTTIPIKIELNEILKLLEVKNEK